MRRLRIEVEGMHCKSCQMLVTEELEDAGASDVAVTLDPAARKGVVECSTSLPPEQVARLIESAGSYRAVKTEEL